MVASGRAIVMESRARTVAFNREVGTSPQPILICSEESLPADGFVANFAWVFFPLHEISVLERL